MFYLNDLFKKLKYGVQNSLQFKPFLHQLQSMSICYPTIYDTCIVDENMKISKRAIRVSRLIQSSLPVPLLVPAASSTL
jgi:hypothetical protein